MITITELLGTSSVAGDRLTINANFLLLENEINDIENTFNINVVTGSMDISNATSGQFKAKTAYLNSLVLPSSGTPTIGLYGTGASAGNATFNGSITSLGLAVSGTGSINILNATGPASFGATASFGGTVLSSDEFRNGPTGIFTDKNTKSASGSGLPFLSINSGGGGITGTFSSPYILTGQESVIYANCAYVSTATPDISNATGFFMQVAGASGSIASTLPAGYKLSIVNTSPTGGQIGTGITGPSATGYYYTGFNLTNGQYSSAGVITGGSSPYRCTVNLMWEPCINQGSTTQKGSWVVLSSNQIVSY